MATKKQQHSHLFVFAHSQSHLFQYGGGVDVRSGCPWGIDVPTVYLWRGCFSLERRRCFPKKKRKTDAAIFEQAALPKSFYPFKQVVITDSILMIQFLLNINKQVKDTVTQESWTVESFLEHWGFSLIIWLNHHFVLIHSRLHHFQLKQKLWSLLLEAVSVHENQFKKLFLANDLDCISQMAFTNILGDPITKRTAQSPSVLTSPLYMQIIITGINVHDV